ncbi:MAG TPA: sodium/glutamate symporter [Rubrivivax sp.]|nr:sodium/glutamate symporter [Rubrivivax sp.]HRY87461.1 sodium/glutamate symporter [Rubrivivax sp.]HRZ59447.1 sodium/glutamate symporter [Rubrivivax sp.]
MLTYKLDMITFAALGAVLLLLGKWAVKRYRFLWQYSIPAPVVGGFGFAIVMWIVYELGLLELHYDDTLYTLAMYVFFVTIGLTTGLIILKQGGRILLLYMLVCWLLAFVQNGVSIGMSYLTGLNPLVGMIAGQASMQGGHGMAASMAPVIESFGVTNALTVGLAASTFGLIAGSLLGGPVGNWLITRRKLKIETEAADQLKSLSDEMEQSAEDRMTAASLLHAGVAVMLILAIGLPTARWITAVTGFSIPGHIFSLFLGIVFYSINERRHWFALSDAAMGTISILALEMFLVMAMMKLKLWELYELALPLALLLVAQVVCTILVAVFIMFRLIGRNYDAAVMSAGFIGHGLGATPNGLVVMDALCSKYGVFSKKAFIIIPVAGTVLTDVVGVPLFVFLANLVGRG